MALNIGGFKRLMLVGDKGVGKSRLMSAFKNKYSTELSIHKGFNELEFHISLNSTFYTVIVVDTTGREDYSDEDADAFILCYSITDRMSFTNIRLKWIKALREYHSTVPIILVATKEDKRTRSSVTKEEGEALRKSIKANKFIESSSKTVTNVKEIFQEGLVASVDGIKNNWCGWCC